MAAPPDNKFFRAILRQQLQRILETLNRVWHFVSIFVVAVDNATPFMSGMAIMTLQVDAEYRVAISGIALDRRQHKASSWRTEQRHWLLPCDPNTAMNQECCTSAYF
jgi:hypothetical protein